MRVLLVLASLAVLASTSADASPSHQSVRPMKKPLANVWVHPSASGSCARSRTPAPFKASTACSSFEAAYSVANRSADASLVLVRGGVYPEQLIRGNRVSSGRITIEPAPKEAVRLSGGLSLGASETSLGPDYLTIRNVELLPFGSSVPGVEMPDARYGIVVHVDSTHVRLEKMRAGNISSFGSTDLQVIGGDFGPCYQTVDPAAHGPCDLNRIGLGYRAGGIVVPTTNILIDGGVFHDYRWAPSCYGPKDCHWRALFAYGVQGFTMRRTIWRNSIFEPWFTLFGDASPIGNHNILIENNYFGRSDECCGHGFSFAWCQNANPGVAAYRNVTFRYNSFARGLTLATPASNNPEGEGGCAIENFKVYGNIFGARHGGCNSHPSVSFSYNVYAGPRSGTCGPGDVNIGGATMPFYKNDTMLPNANDFALVGRRRAVDNRVPLSVGCPGRDRSRVRRPQNRGFCDAGAHERVLPVRR